MHGLKWPIISARTRTAVNPPIAPSNFAAPANTPCVATWAEKARATRLRTARGDFSLLRDRKPDGMHWKIDRDTMRALVQQLPGAQNHAGRRRQRKVCVRTCSAAQSSLLLIAFGQLDSRLGMQRLSRCVRACVVQLGRGRRSSCPEVQ